MNFRPATNRVLSCVVAVVAIFFGTPVCHGRGEFETLQNCRYLFKRANDGDSFHVSVNGKEYIFRLYFVDAPETDTEFPDRVETQAKYFGLTVSQTVELGELAKNFTRERLSHPFTVRTRFQDARGQSKLERFYAFVQTETGDLGEQLIENGLARIYGMAGRPSDTDTIRTEWQKLQQLEAKAKSGNVGAWGAKDGRMTNRAKTSAIAKGPDAFDQFFHPVSPRPNEQQMERSTALIPTRTVPSSELGKGDEPAAKLDVNTASATELGNVQGIGPAIARNIIAARPFKTADDLKKVKGIGDGKRYQQIRPFFK